MNLNAGSDTQKSAAHRPILNMCTSPMGLHSGNEGCQQPTAISVSLAKKIPDF